MRKISKLAQVRKTKELTQEQLAETSGINRAMIARYEAGMGKPSVETLTKLADALGVTVDELIERAG